ncbi:hypothetical protein M9H77_36555 [Catharanthus roseus]|uniref:Uncharacterized protein n=1 Tax=Catharanthus roseus TaxID=4058 RepID=A0ACB9ZT02_CATRO|nr:hypothetical protein M9H77_36555 [Catharanthus roseus]
MLGHKTENKLIDLRIRLDTMTVDEVRWTPYRSDEISDVWVSTYHGMIAYFDCVKPYMPDRVIRHIPAIPPSWCTDDYMPWFLPRTHPRIQNPYRLPRGMQMPTIAPITPQVLLDMVARELDRDDIDDATKVSRASDMIKRYHQTQR